MTERLMRSHDDRMVGGVCGGLARYLNIDTVFVRLAFVLFTLAGGAGLVVYLILLVMMPLDTTAGDGVNYDPAAAEERRRRTTMVVGAGLVLVGTWYLLGRIPGFAWLSFGKLWPVLVIAAGVAMIVGYVRSERG